MNFAPVEQLKILFKKEVVYTSTPVLRCCFEYSDKVLVLFGSVI